MKEHTNKEYEAELRQIRERLLLMAGRVEEMIANSIDSLMRRDLALARHTINEDHKVNRCEVELDEFCLNILARRQPLGADLRFITIALKMVTDLERIGDLAVNICERVIKLSLCSEMSAHQNIPSMAYVVQRMLRVSIDAYVMADAKKAEQVLKEDDEVDELYHSLVREVIAKMAKEDHAIEPSLHIQAIAKWLERIGDHCTNLAELVVFMVRGKDIRHLGKLDSDEKPGHCGLDPESVGGGF